jgi:hypothetical protein
LGFDQDLRNFKVSTPFTRSRKYRKNDIRYVEQKNDSMVRKKAEKGVRCLLMLEPHAPSSIFT